MNYAYINKYFKLYYAILLFVITCTPHNLQCQNIDLLHFQTLENLSSRFYHFPNDSMYVYEFISFDNENPIGIWTEQDLTGLDNSFGKKVVLYDQFLNVQNHFQLNLQILQPHYIGFQNDQLFLNFHPYDLGILTGLPEIQHNFSVLGTNDLLLGYEPNDNILTAYFNVLDPDFGNLSFDNNFQPFSGFRRASGIKSSAGSFNPSMVVVNDFVTIGCIEVYENHIVNDDISLVNETGNLGFAFFKIENDVVSLSPMISNIGNSFNYGLFPSQSQADYYRVGLIRGENIEITPAGQTYTDAPSDSSYCVFISKENQYYESEWITPLYAYNNFMSDTTSSIFDDLYVSPKFYSLVEMNNDVYLSQKLYIYMNPSDSLQFRDFFGADTMLYSVADYVSNDGSVSEYWKIPYSKNLVYRIDENGNPISFLSLDNNFSVTGQSNSQNAYMFKVDSVLAWTHNYKASADTLLEIIRETNMGISDTTVVALPEGAGIVILWLNEDLTMNDHWLIPYESPEMMGLSIESINFYNTDTILIQGSIFQNTTTTLDIFGSSDPVLYEENVSFFAFYGTPATTNTSDISNEKSSIVLYPNPSKGSITITSALFAPINAYRIHDLSGRMLKQQRLQNSSSHFNIDVSFLDKGLYVISTESDGSLSSTKFVID